MKLRLRSLESKDTLRIKVPDPCTIQHLKDSLIRALPSSSSAASLRFSLNREDELHGSSPEDSLLSMGITSGDLIFYTFNLSGFSSQSAAQIQASQSRVPDASLRDSSPSQSRGDSNASGKQIQESDSELKRAKLENCFSAEHPQSLRPEFMAADMITCGVADKGEKKLVSDGEEMDVDDESIATIEKNCSRPTFLRRLRVLKEELGFDRNAHKLLVTFVHAVLLESGFVLIDPNCDDGDHPFHIPEDWPSQSFTMSLQYTLPELLGNEDKSSISGMVSLKFQSLGHLVNVYGSLGRSRGSSVYRISLDDKKFAPYLDWIWANSESSSIIDEIDQNPERQGFEFWNVVKHALALPLLIDLCEQTGLPPPASFMRLPGDLKLKILEVLSGVDIARLECVCTELRFLASNNDLWKLKCSQEFGCKEEIHGSRHWKARYIAFLEDKKLKNRAITRWRGPSFRRLAVARPQPYPFAVPRVIGGDYDVGLGIRLPPFGFPGQSSSRRHGFLPNCDLGVEDEFFT